MKRKSDTKQTKQGVSSNREKAASLGDQSLESKNKQTTTGKDANTVRRKKGTPGNSEQIKSGLYSKVLY